MNGERPIPFPESCKTEEPQKGETKNMKTRTQQKQNKTPPLPVRTTKF